MQEKPTQEQLAHQHNAAEAFAEAAAIMARLRRIPDGCPWDLKQTLDTIKPHTLEEVYEVFDAIDRRAWDELRDELGDLLLQVLFYAQIAHDEGHFSIEDVARSLGAKLLRRHPHIFGDAQAQTPDDVVATWDAVKARERASKPARDDSYLDAVPRTTPALIEATKLGSKAAKVGFDWSSREGVLDKLREELDELLSETEKAVDVGIEEELGDLLLTVVSLARHLKVDPEQALKKANGKFRRRFSDMEQSSGGSQALRGKSAEELDQLWTKAKTQERQSQ